MVWKNMMNWNNGNLQFMMRLAEDYMNLNSIEKQNYWVWKEEAFCEHNSKGKKYQLKDVTTISGKSYEHISFK